MSNRKLYILKVACVRLHDLKLKERTYKSALVKRACKHLLKKADAYAPEEVSWSQLSPSARDELARQVDWNRGVFGVPLLGRLLRSIFENDKHRKLYKQYASRFDTEAEMRKWLADNGVRPEWIDDIVRQATELQDYGVDYAQDYAEEETKRGKSRFDKAYEAAKRNMRALEERGRKRGYLSGDKPGAAGGDGILNPSIHQMYAAAYAPRGNYLSEMIPVYDPGYLAAVGRSPGVHITNNYYVDPRTGRAVPVQDDKDKDKDKDKDPASSLVGKVLDPSSISLGAGNLVAPSGVPTTASGPAPGTWSNPTGGVTVDEDGHMTYLPDPDLPSIEAISVDKDGNVLLDPSQSVIPSVAGSVTPVVEPSNLDNGWKLADKAMDAADQFGVDTSGVRDTVNGFKDWLEADSTRKETAEMVADTVADIAGGGKPKDPTVGKVK